MDVAVGSENPAKLEATEEALGNHADRVEAVAVDSGVAEQPRGIAETVQGARNRARRAYEQSEHDLGVGIEGGVAQLDETDRLYLVMWAATTDGRRTTRAAGPSIPLPEDVATAVRNGRELGPVLDEYLGRSGVKRAEGAAGVFTGGRTTRRQALREAVAGTLGPFLTDHYTAGGK